jgi:hypothetical protein
LRSVQICDLWVHRRDEKVVVIIEITTPLPKM